MLRLDIPKEPYWIDLRSGARLFVRPLSSPIMDAARVAAITEMVELQGEFDKRRAAGESVDDLPNMNSEPIRLALAKHMMTRALARCAILAWEGVFPRKGNEPAEVSDAAVNDLMGIWFVCEEFWEKYTSRIELLVTEGNDLRPGASGILAAGLDIAPDAMSNPSHAAAGKAIA